MRPQRLASVQDGIHRRTVAQEEPLRFVRPDDSKTNRRGRDTAQRDVHIKSERVAALHAKSRECRAKHRRKVARTFARPRSFRLRRDRRQVEYLRARSRERAALCAAGSVRNMSDEHGVDQSIVIRQGGGLLVGRCHERQRRASHVPKVSARVPIEPLRPARLAQVGSRLEPSRVREAPGRKSSVHKLQQEPTRSPSLLDSC